MFGHFVSAHRHSTPAIHSWLCIDAEAHERPLQGTLDLLILKILAHCFRFRNKLGLDVALEALTEAWRSKRLKLDELNRIAKKLRVQRVMQPYLDTVVL